MPTIVAKANKIPTIIIIIAEAAIGCSNVAKKILVFVKGISLLVNFNAISVVVDVVFNIVVVEIVVVEGDMWFETNEVEVSTAFINGLAKQK